MPLRQAHHASNPRKRPVPAPSQRPAQAQAPHTTQPTAVPLTARRAEQLAQTQPINAPAQPASATAEIDRTGSESHCRWDWAWGRRSHGGQTPGCYPCRYLRFPPWNLSHFTGNACLLIAQSRSSLMLQSGPWQCFQHGDPAMLRQCEALPPEPANGWYHELPAPDCVMMLRMGRAFYVMPQRTDHAS